MTKGTCKVADCGRPVLVKSTQLCQTHQVDYRSGTPFRKIRRKVSPGKPCLFPPCKALSTSAGYCNTHYNQVRFGRPLRMTMERFPVTRRDADGNKWCRTCDSWLPEASFASSSGKKDGLQSRCRSCNSAIYRSRAEAVRDKMREARFGLTREGFDRLLASQGGRCAICRSGDPGSSWWHTDHDHACCPEPGRSCGKCVRGLLCSFCNSAIGYLKDDPAIMRAAAAYVERTRTYR